MFANLANHPQVLQPIPSKQNRGLSLSTDLGDDEQPQQTPTSRHDAKSVQGDYASLTGAARLVKWRDDHEAIHKK